MATKYIEKFETAAALIAAAPDTGKALGVGAIDGQLFVNEGGVAKPVGQPTMVTETGSFTASQAEHANRTTLLGAAAGGTVTLPAATGSGDKYRFVVSVLLTSAAWAITAPAGSILNGMALINNTGDSTAATVDAYPTGASDEQFNFTQSVGGGKIGDWVEVEDIVSGIYAVTAFIQGQPDPTNPFASV
jgi:hypothetical protein